MIPAAAPDLDAVDEDELFRQLPSVYADPAWLVSCFGDAISRETARRLLATKRLQGRLSRLLADQHRLPTSIAKGAPAMEEVDQAIAYASAEKLSEIAMKAGAVYWAATLARTISGREAAILRNELGAALCTLAVANKDLAGPEQPLEPLTRIRERIEADGWRCLVAWCEAVGQFVAARVRLKLPPQSPLAEPLVPCFATIGPLIVRRLAE
ncbi:hypothetical protein [Nitratireductor soli]|uniref:hypothetical protein n=1 Tax=Nitratireductor soli TaxID=1670619 RepID=UPI00065E2627|nr:hypothetical protein [Nitratireductor soli]